MNVITVACICVLTAVMAKVIQPTNRDLAATLSIATVVVVAITFTSGIFEIVSNIGDIVTQANINTSYLKLAFKTLGICYVCEISSSCCRDCGETALAGIIDIAGRISISFLCLPLVEVFLKVVKNILEM